MRPLTRKELLQDERILAAILAGHHVNPSGLRHGSFGFRSYNPKVKAPIDGPACAVGCGLLYRGIQATCNSAIEAFAKTYGVSAAYACGVSDGFEEWGSHISTGHDLTKEEKQSVDYQRGYAVGEAVGLYLADEQDDAT